MLLLLLLHTLLTYLLLLLETLLIGITWFIRGCNIIWIRGGILLILLLHWRWYIELLTIVMIFI